MDTHDLPLPTNINLPEGYYLKKSKIGDLLEYNIRKFDPNYPFYLNKDMGSILSQPSPVTDDLITMSSELNEEIQRKGVGKEIYKLAEKDTGKKIIPDFMLTQKSSGIHNKHGLGKDFGLSDYEQIIKKAAEKEAEIHNKTKAGKGIPSFSFDEGHILEEVPPLWPKQHAEEKYQKIKRIMEANGINKFKSILPLLKPLGYGLTVAGIAAAPNPAQAAVTEGISNIVPGGVEDLGVSDEQKSLDRQYLDRIRQLSQKRGM